MLSIDLQGEFTMTLIQSMKLPKAKAKLTQNGSLAFSNTGNPLVDMLSEFGSTMPLQKGKNSDQYTMADANRAIKLFKEAFEYQPLYAVRLLFYFRDVRGGGKNKVLFTSCYKWLAENYTELAIHLIPLIPEYGYFEDFRQLLDTKIGPEVAVYWYNRVMEDFDKLLHNGNKNLSLAAKWFPSEGSGKNSKNAFKFIMKTVGVHTNFGKKQTRDIVTAIRRQLNLVEQKMTANDWYNIDYSKVPAQAIKQYSKAFGRHDPFGFTQFHEKLERGEVKVNMGTMNAVEILHSMRLGNLDKKMANNYWNNLPLPKVPSKVLVMGDTSGSMQGSSVANSKYKPYDIMAGLAIYFADKLPKDSPFYGHFITFSSRPQLVDLTTGKNLWEKYQILERNSIVSNTDIDKAFQMVLNTAKQHRLTQEAMPDVILVISDGEFDGNSCRTNFDTWETEFTNNGYKLPLIVSWNVNSYVTKMATAYRPGIAMISGFSEGTLANILDGDLDLTPFKAMLRIVEDNPRYNCITF